MGGGNYPEGAAGAAGAAGAMAFMCFMWIIYLAIVVLCIAGLWKVFVKAGKPGWAAIVPIYNLVVLLEVVGKPIWWIILMLIPCVNIVVSFIVMIELAKKFGQGVGFGIGLALLGFIFLPILGFGSYQYEGTAAESAPPPQQ